MNAENTKLNINNVRSVSPEKIFINEIKKGHIFTEFKKCPAWWSNLFNASSSLLFTRKLHNQKILARHYYLSGS
jgi:hypothetical protein